MVPELSALAPTLRAAATAARQVRGSSADRAERRAAYRDLNIEVNRAWARVGFVHALAPVWDRRVILPWDEILVLRAFQAALEAIGGALGAAVNVQCGGAAGPASAAGGLLEVLAQSLEALSTSRRRRSDLQEAAIGSFGEAQRVFVAEVRLDLTTRSRIIKRRKLRVLVRDLRREEERRGELRS